MNGGGRAMCSAMRPPRPPGAANRTCRPLVSDVSRTPPRTASVPRQVSSSEPSSHQSGSPSSSSWSRCRPLAPRPGAARRRSHALRPRFRFASSRGRGDGCGWQSGSGEPRLVPRGVPEEPSAAREPLARRGARHRWTGARGHRSAFDREPSSIGYRLFPGGPTITTYERPVYAADDPCRSHPSRPVPVVGRQSDRSPTRPTPCCAFSTTHARTRGSSRLGTRSCFREPPSRRPVRS